MSADPKNAKWYFVIQKNLGIYENYNKNCVKYSI